MFCFLLLYYLVLMVIFLSLLSAITLYCTIFYTNIKEGANQADIARLPREGGYANTGLTFLWYVVTMVTVYRESLLDTPYKRVIVPKAISLLLGFGCPFHGFSC